VPYDPSRAMIACLESGEDYTPAHFHALLVGRRLVKRKRPQWNIGLSGLSCAMIPSGEWESGELGDEQIDYVEFDDAGRLL